MSTVHNSTSSYNINNNKLYRSRTDYKIAGVCGGIGKYIDVDSSIVRLFTITLALVTGIFPIVFAYIIAIIIIPKSDQ